MPAGTHNVWKEENKEERRRKKAERNHAIKELVFYRYYPFFCFLFLFFSFFFRADGGGTNKPLWLASVELSLCGVLCFRDRVDDSRSQGLCSPSPSR